MAAEASVELRPKGAAFLSMDTSSKDNATHAVEDPRWVTLARIRRAQGRKGELLAELMTDFPERFAERKSVWLIPPEHQKAREPWQAEIVHHWLHKGGVVLQFAGVDSITAAETLRDCLVAIPHEQRAKLGEDEFYVGDLMGSELVDVAGGSPRVVGVIEDVDRASGPMALLVVKVDGAKDTALIPLVKAWLHGFDADAKRLTMALPEGLVEVNF